MERLDYPGLYVFHTVANATPDEIASNRPLPPERLREIEEAKKDSRIRRMTVFVPGA